MGIKEYFKAEDKKFDHKNYQIAHEGKKPQSDSSCTSFILKW